MGVLTWAQARFPQQRVFWAVSLGHLVNDIFMSMGPVMLVFISSSGILPMNAAQLGLAVSLRQIAGALSQPLFGGIGDRTGGRWLGAGGVAWVIIVQTLSVLLAFTGSFTPHGRPVHRRRAGKRRVPPGRCQPRRRSRPGQPSAQHVVLLHVRPSSVWRSARCWAASFCKAQRRPMIQPRPR
ncbi:MAG: hypothetical protein HND48_22850 [Chloroflexi bacterium]|nr:hypothetical protein [Chloroflexota bacterium]